jgi:hypothetical protein
VLKQVDTGAATQVWAATSEDLPGGAYLADCTVRNDQVADHAANDAAASRLWSLSEQLVGEAFPTWPGAG